MDAVSEDLAVVEVTEEDAEEEIEMENLLWRPLSGDAERRRRRSINGRIWQLIPECHKKTISR